MNILLGVFFVLFIRVSLSFIPVKICRRSLIKPINAILRRGKDSLPSEPTKQWRSGYILGTGTNPTAKTRGRNDPWWMREEERNNPRSLPEYIPWWLSKLERVDESLKLPELRAEAIRRGLNVQSLKKAEIIALLERSNSHYDLSDDGFTSPIFIPHKETSTPSCYPEVYEAGVDIEALKAQMKMMPAPR